VNPVVRPPADLCRANTGQTRSHASWRFSVPPTRSRKYDEMVKHTNQRRARGGVGGGGSPRGQKRVGGLGGVSLCRAGREEKVWCVDVPHWSIFCLIGENSPRTKPRFNAALKSSTLFLGVLHVPGVRVWPEKRENSTDPLWRHSAPQKRKDFHPAQQISFHQLGGIPAP
jgi:hypothetical protein